MNKPGEREGKTIVDLLQIKEEVSSQTEHPLCRGGKGKENMVICSLVFGARM